MKKLILCVVIFLLSFSTSAADKTESAYERVMRTGTIKCGYNQYAPYFIKNINTGVISGIFYELTEELAKNAELKVEWVEEVSHTDIFTGLAARRYDVLCSGIWPSSARAKVGSFTVPVFYSPVMAWGRAGEARFKNLKAVNNSSIRVAVIDGAQEDIIARTDFPKALRIASPAMASFTDNFLKIAAGKADITFVEPSLIKAYVAANPGSLEQVSAEPLRFFGNTLAVAKGETELKELLDSGLQELLDSGRVEAILQKYEIYKGSFLRVAKPYEEVK